MPKEVIDMRGQCFGRLTVLERSESISGQSTRWLCKCSCGTEKITNRDSLISGRVVSCGCYHKEQVRKLGYENRTHGASKTKTYYVWWSMIQRCHNENVPCFEHYGGRGITVCEQWINSFLAFVNDMGEKPEGLTLDRKNNDGPYAAWNCQWTTPKAQAQNRRRRKGASNEKS